MQAEGLVPGPRGGWPGIVAFTLLIASTGLVCAWRAAGGVGALGAGVGLLGLCGAVLLFWAARPGTPGMVLVTVFLLAIVGCVSFGVYRIQRFSGRVVASRPLPIGRPVYSEEEFSVLAGRLGDIGRGDEMGSLSERELNILLDRALGVLGGLAAFRVSLAGGVFNAELSVLADGSGERFYNIRARGVGAVKKGVLSVHLSSLELGEERAPEMRAWSEEKITRLLHEAPRSAGYLAHIDWARIAGDRLELRLRPADGL